MWKTTILLIVLMASFFPLVEGVKNDSNLTLRAVCIDAYGNLCQDTSKWTVILPNGTTLYNETAGVPTAKGIANFTVWFNTTGTWYVLVNFSSQNHTTEWNVVVEDYDTQTLLDVAEDWDMTGGLILYGLIVLGLLYAGFTLKEEHAVLKLILVGVGILLMPAGFIIASSTMSGLTSDAMFGVVVVSASLILIVAVYTFLYFFIKISKTLMGQNKDLEKK